MKRRVIAAWIVYDIAVHGYGLMIPAVGFAVYFTSFVAAGHPFADALWSVAVAVPLIAAGLLSPWLGIVAESGGRRRLLLVVVTLVCAVASALMRWVGQGDVAAGMALFFVAQLGFLLATALYNSYLPLISTPRNAARISGLGRMLADIASLWRTGSYGNTKEKRRLSDGVGCCWGYRWWRRRESNPRPQALYRQFYILSRVV